MSGSRQAGGKRLRANLGECFAAVWIGGYASPPLRTLTPEKHFEIVQRETASGAGIVIGRARVSFAEARS